jgi:hypothetical protein
MTPLHTVHPAVHIGDDSDAAILLRTRRHGHPPGPWTIEPADGWAILHCAKTPWHADLVGYDHGRAAPQDSPERWWADRPRRTALNLVDSHQQLPELVLPILDHGAALITQWIDRQLSVLVHCNIGMSRSPAVVLWWSHRADPTQTYDEALDGLKTDHPFTRTDTAIGRLVRDAWTQEK